MPMRQSSQYTTLSAYNRKRLLAARSKARTDAEFRLLVNEYAEQGSLDMAISGGARETARYLQQFEDNGLDCKDLIARVSTPIEFRPVSGRTAFGYEATVLADFCDLFLDARKRGDVLSKKGRAIADRCEILVRGFARVGIIALVDEATGYQYDRERHALAEILEKFISKELVKWVPVFPTDFYSELFRLKNKPRNTLTNKRPMWVGTLTLNLVYKRLAPGVLEELQRVTPRDARGRLKHKLFQRLTEDVGHPKLKEHFLKLITLMNSSDDWEDFSKRVDKALPKFEDPKDRPLMVQFDAAEDADDDDE